MEEYGATAPQTEQTNTVAQLVGQMEQEIFQCMKRRRVRKEGEMERYLATPVAEPSTDILGWWKQHADTYPCLARMARDYLAIPATSAPTERVFSAGADLITDKRGSLGEETNDPSLHVPGQLAVVISFALD
jgi:hAT family C-terminal dimerisation region